MINARTAKARADAKGQQCVNIYTLLLLVAQLGILPPPPMLSKLWCKEQHWKRYVLVQLTFISYFYEKGKSITASSIRYDREWEED